MEQTWPTAVPAVERQSAQRLNWQSRSTRTPVSAVRNDSGPEGCTLGNSLHRSFRSRCRANHRHTWHSSLHCTWSTSRARRPREEHGLPRLRPFPTRAPPDKSIASTAYCPPGLSFPRKSCSGAPYSRCEVLERTLAVRNVFTQSATHFRPAQMRFDISRIRKGRRRS